MIVRIQGATGRVEIVTFIAIPGRIEESEINPKPAPEVLFIEESDGEQTPEVAEYIELGDLDYAKLLSADTPGKNVPLSPTGQILSNGLGLLDENFRVKGKSEGADEFTKLSGADGEGPDELTRIRGQKLDFEDPSLKSAIDAAAKAQNEQLALQVRLYQDRIEELQKKLEESQNAILPPTVGGDTSALTSIFGKLFGSKKNKVEAGTPQNEPTPDARTDNQTEKDDAPPSDSELLKLLKQIENGGFTTAIDKAKLDAAQLTKDIGSPRAKRFIEGMVSSLVTEKSKLLDVAKKLNTSIRQKELEFKNKERGLQEEIRRREELLKQKDNHIVRTKDQISQISVQLERLKQNASQGSESTALKQKFRMSQKMLQITKEENQVLSKKIDDLKQQLMTAQSNKLGPSTNDFGDVKAKLDRTLKQVEELKRANLHLSEKVSEKSKKDKGGTPGNIDDLKRKLDVAQRLSSASEKEVEKLQLRIEEGSREEARLKKEVIVLQGELKKIRTNRTPPRAA
jgi:hypothetical protein